MMKRLFLWAMIALSLWNCTENIDDSSRYVFKDDTAISYMQKHEDSYSEYLNVLKNVKVSSISESTLFQLLSARGNYTCFAPTNEAIQTYLEDLVETGLISSPSWDAFPTERKKDSIQKVIAYNSIIDGADEVFYPTNSFPVENNGELPLANLNDRKLTVRYVANEADSIYVAYDCPLNVKNRDIYVINGVIHQIEKVIAPRDITMASMMTEIIDNNKEGFIVASRVVLACGMEDTLRATEDMVYRELYLRGIVHDFDAKAFGWVFHGGSQHPTAYAPEHRKFGFTLFAETDDFWRAELGKEPKDITPADVQQWVLDNHQYTKGDEFTTGTDYANPKNLLNQWITYHMLPMKIASHRLVFHENERGFSHTLQQITIPVFEYYATMGKRRLIKLYESKESNGVFLNRFPKLNNGRKGDNHELYCEESKTGSYIDNKSDRVLEYEALNGIIYAIDKPLAFTDEVRENLSKERIRFDAESLFPEAMTNDQRKKHSTNPKDQFVHAPNTCIYQYYTGLDMNDETHYIYLNAYNYGWCNNQEDEIKAEGHYEVTITLPPVPRIGTYELRYRVLPNGDRGVVQFYFGDDPNRLTPTDIPVDLTISGTDSRFGYEADTDDMDYNAEIDKRMRNNNRMKGEEGIGYGDGGSSTSRSASANIRYILTRQKLDPDKTYYLRIKSVLDSDRKELYLDHLEWCSKDVYDNPADPEDIW